MNMFPFLDKEFKHGEALELKYAENESIAKEFKSKQTTINMTFDNVEDAAGFTGAIFKSDKEKVYIIEPNFLNPRTNEELFHDYSTNCDAIYRGEEYYTESPRYGKRIKPRKERSNDYIPSSHYYDNYQEPSYTEYNDLRTVSPDRSYAPIQKKQKYPDDESRRDTFDEVHIDNNKFISTDTPAVNEPVKKPKWFKMIGLVVSNKLKVLQNKKPFIQMITATDNELLGDVLDAQQQKEIIRQLSTCASPISFQLSPEKKKITNLARVWVFRLFSTEKDSIAWVGFDYENQIEIEKHVKQLQSVREDGRLAIYDSHIRYGKMPVIVTPNQSKGYYFSDENQVDLVTLQVTFIENNPQKVTFVYRV
ncbi:hypothetical protein INT48_006512 [Thamnidium elegans]|uniref:Uncharacterized protein n=1 Tax=Thamnidium elegans TaxID=101142 RepID=A0A8H7VUL8_9FUNG|nr:hypothetical protein INT48_006512 [Thamnidium elegans]